MYTQKINVPMRVIYSIFVFSLALILAIIFDLSPYLRGPQDSILPSRWPYYFVNTIDKLWAPLAVIGLFFIVYYFIEGKKQISKNSEKVFLLIMVLLIFFFQISLVYSSRFGTTILFRRMVNPGINGYFSSAVTIKDTSYYLHHFKETLEKLDQHGRGHPPGSILILKGIIYFFEKTPTVTKIASQFIRPPIAEAKLLWNPLTEAQRVAAVFSAFFLHFIAALSVLPVYFLSKHLFNKQVAIKALFLYALIPSLSFFALLFDPFYAIFPILSALFLYLGLKKQSFLLLFLSGLTCSLSLFFSLSTIPALIIPIIILLFSSNRRKTFIIKKVVFPYIIGFFSFLISLYLLGFDMISTSLLIIKFQAPREYLPWLIFNPYDFFLFLGIPISLLFLYVSFRWAKHYLQLGNLESKILVSFWIVFIVLIVSGISRGEVVRIWLPLMYVPIIFIADFLT